MIEVITTDDGERYLTDDVEYNGERAMVSNGDFIMRKYKQPTVTNTTPKWEYFGMTTGSWYHNYIKIILIFLGKVGTNTRNGSSKVQGK